MDGFLPAIAAAFFGFFALAFLLLFPVYRFIRREEARSESWTPDAIARRQREHPSSGDGASPEGDGTPGEAGKG